MCRAEELEQRRGLSSELDEMWAYVTNGVSLLQTQLSHREGHEARRTGLEAMPLDQHIEGRHGEREPGVARRPHAVHDPLAMADYGRDREHRLDEHPVL